MADSKPMENMAENGRKAAISYLAKHTNYQLLLNRLKTIEIGINSFTEDKELYGLLCHKHSSFHILKYESLKSTRISKNE